MTECLQDSRPPLYTQSVQLDAHKYTSYSAIKPLELIRIFVKNDLAYINSVERYTFYL